MRTNQKSKLRSHPLYDNAAIAEAAAKFTIDELARVIVDLQGVIDDGILDCRFHMERPKSTCKMCNNKRAIIEFLDKSKHVN